MDLLILVAAALLVCLFGLLNSDWRAGLFVILATGFLQDPLRKFVPGQPVALAAAVGVVMLFVWGTGLKRFGRDARTMSLNRHHPEVVRALVVFGGLVFFQAILTVVNFGSLPLAGIGLIAYLGPIPAIWIGWWYGRAGQRSGRDGAWLVFAYVGFALAVAVSVYLSWQGFDSQLFKQVGDAGSILVFYGEAGIITLHTGILRAPDITGWHLGAAVCLSLVLATVRPTVARIAVFAAIIVFLVAAIYLTGRRKALAMVALFSGILIVLLHFSRNRDARKAGVALTGVAVVAFGMLFNLPGDLTAGTSYGVYAERGQSLAGDAWERFYKLGLASVGGAIDAAGFLGYGAGVVSQGGQHFGGGQEFEAVAAVGAAEGGLGKIIVELGIPGLLVLAWVLWVFAGAVRKLLAGTDPATGSAVVPPALAAFLITNAVLFVTASQIFGDPFVLILLGMVFGALLATPRLRERLALTEASVLRPGGTASIHRLGNLRN